MRLAAAFLLTFVMALTVTTAEAHTLNRCISKAEFNDIERGWARFQVHRRFNATAPTESVSSAPDEPGGWIRFDLWSNRTCVDRHRDVVVGYVQRHRGNDILWVVRVKCWYIKTHCRRVV
jgi:hypothetical protein